MLTGKAIGERVACHHPDRRLSALKSFATKRMGRQLRGGALRLGPQAPVMAHHAKGPDTDMAKSDAAFSPIVIACAQNFAELPEPAGHGPKRRAGSPDDADPVPLLLVMDMQMATGDRWHAAGGAGFEEPCARFGSIAKVLGLGLPTFRRRTACAYCGLNWTFQFHAHA